MTGATPPDALVCTPRVLIVENNEVTRDLLVDLISHWGYAVYVASGEGDELIADALAKARAYCCHIALVDMRLKDDTDGADDTGLALIQDLKPTETIVISGYLDKTKIRLINRELRGAGFIGKEEIPEGVEAELAFAAQQFCASQRAVQIGPANLIREIKQDFAENQVVIAADEIEDILTRLFPDASHLELEKLNAENPTTTVSSVPRPKNVILRTTQTVHGARHQPVVVKLARAAKMETEVNRFQNHIAGRLVKFVHPSLEESVILWNLGGAVYTLLGGATHRIPTFSGFFAQAAAPEINTILNRFFGETWAHLYATTREYRDGSLFEAYCDVWETKWFDERVRGFYRQNSTGWMDVVNWQQYHAPEPVSWLIDHVAGSSDASRMSNVGTAVTHGDLHGDNLLVDPDHRAWVIDFERTGPGPILQDLVELEADILNRLTCTTIDLDTFYQVCILITREERLLPIAGSETISSPEAMKALEVISTLRRHAAQHLHPQSDAREYLWGLLFNTLFRATIMQPDVSRGQERALMLAGILCQRLEDWGGPWPPAHWPAVS